MKNIYSDGELMGTATAEEFSVIQIEGNTEAKRTQKGFSMDDERLKQCKTAFGKRRFSMNKNNGSIAQKRKKIEQ